MGKILTLFSALYSLKQNWYMLPYGTLGICTNFSSFLPPETDLIPHSQLLLTCKRKLSQTNGISSKIWGPFCRLKTKKPYVRSLTSPRILKTKCVYVTLRNFGNMHKFLVFPSSRDGLNATFPTTFNL